MQRYCFFLIYANEKHIIEDVYIHSIYTAQIRFLYVFWGYPMAILWLSYGYPMVKVALGVVKEKHHPVGRRKCERTIELSY